MSIDQIIDKRKLRNFGFWFDTLTIELLSYCNFRCKHCLLPDWYKAKAEYLDPDLAIKVIREAWVRGANSLSLTGGETTLYPHKDLIKIISEARSRGMYVMLNTNASGITDWLAKKFSQLKVHVKVSLYGIDRESYLQFTGVDAFESVLKGLNFLKKHKAWLMIDGYYTKIHKDLGLKPKDILAFMRQFSKQARVNKGITRGWWGKYDVYKIKVEREDEDYEDLGDQLYSFHPYHVPIGDMMDPCAAYFSPGIFVDHNGRILMCPFNDELVTTAKTEKWPSIYYKKVVAFRNLPWPGGRCNYKNFIIYLGKGLQLEQADRS